MVVDAKNAFDTHLRVAGNRLTRAARIEQ